jgi:hypothetical protein
VRADADALTQHLVRPRAFSFRELRECTPDLDGPQRAAVFDRLPLPLQLQAWADLRGWWDERSNADFELWCRRGV